MLLDQTVGAKVIDIMYRGAFADLSTRSRLDDVARDVAGVRDLLGLILQHTDIEFDARFVYRQSTKLVRDLEGLRTAFEMALEASRE